MEQEWTGTFNRCSAPSELKITDIRFTDVVGAHALHADENLYQSGHYRPGH